MPLLWNMILHVSCKAHGSHWHIQLLRDWPLRADSSQLFIKLTSDFEQESSFCSIRAIMDFVVNRSTYWNSLDSLLGFPQCHDILEKNHFSMLTSISVRPPKGAILTFSEPSCYFLLQGTSTLICSLTSINNATLGRFRIQILTVAECLKVLNRSPSLKECHLESVFSPETRIFPSPMPLYSLVIGSGTPRHYPH